MGRGTWITGDDGDDEMINQTWNAKRDRTEDERRESAVRVGKAATREFFWDVTSSFQAGIPQFWSQVRTICANIAQCATVCEPRHLIEASLSIPTSSQMLTGADTGEASINSMHSNYDMILKLIV
jgi:hypothetical protein